MQISLRATPKILLSQEITGAAQKLNNTSKMTQGRHFSLVTSLSLPSPIVILALLFEPEPLSTS